MRILPLFCAISCLLLSQANAQATTTTIAAFGDSLFAGYGLNATDAFPAKLEQRLTADGYHVKVLNHGVSGDTTAGGLGRVDYMLAAKPDLVILELGANDILRGFPPATTQNNLDTMLGKIKASGVKILLAGIEAPLNYGAKFASDFNTIYPSLAAKYNTPLYPSILQGVIGHPDLIQADGVHPTAQGVDVMVAGMAPVVEKLLTN